MSERRRATTSASRDRAERLFEEALARPAADRREFISAACADDPTLAAELRSLLDHAPRADAFFESLAGAVLPSLMPDMLCDGRYQLRGLLGAGGMGAVYRAWDSRLSREVALKFLSAPLNVVPGADRRLLREARAVAGLEHVNVCTVHEVGVTEEGWPFISMALYDGETLRERIARGPVTVREAVDVTIQVARGLEAAHAQGIVHRDVKPGNIMLTRRGVVKLLDFGLATGASTDAAGAITPGTLAYMSPEQVRGEAVGPASDLWSLGVVLHEMLGGTRPFQGESTRALADAICNAAPPPPGGPERAVPPSLAKVLARLLAKDPASRHGSADELLADLVPELPSSPASRRHVPLTSRPPTLALLLTIAVVTAAGGMAWWRGGSSSFADAATGAAAISPQTLAVLPFTGDGLDPEDAYLANGLTHELTRALAAVQSIRLVGRTSAPRLAREHAEIRSVARVLGARTVLAGNLERADDRIRVHVRLHDGQAGAELWSNTYERHAADVAPLPRELALQIATALEARLSPVERDRLGDPGTRSSVALTLYLRGRHFANQRTEVGYDLATTYFTQAIAADSSYGAPWAGLAGVYSQRGMAGRLPSREARERSRAAVLRAIALDDGLAEAHAVLGAWRHAYEWNTEGAERELRRAIELDPGLAAARMMYGNVLRSVGRFDEALAQQATAAELDPLVPAYHETLAFTLVQAGRGAEALARIHSALELDSTYWRAHAVHGVVHEAAGRHDEALRAYARANALAGAGLHRTTADLARVLARNGKRDEARRLVNEVRARAAATAIHEPAAATALFALGDVAAAYEWLEQGYRDGHPDLRFIAADTRFAPMRGDPRFRALLQRLRLPP